MRTALEGTEPYTIILSKSDDLAKEHLRTIRSELEENDAIAEVYGRVMRGSATWNAHELRLANGSIIRALGTGSQIRGRKQKAARPTRIVIDDPESDSIIFSDREREKNWLWLTREVVFAGASDLNLDILGTPIHPECLVEKLRDSTGWNAHVYRAIERWPDRLDLWKQWAEELRKWTEADPAELAQEFYRTHREEMDAGAEVLWPEHEPLYQLMFARETLGPAAFASEKQMEAHDPRAMEWPAEFFDGADFWFDDWPIEDLVVRTLYLDPAMGRHASVGDYSAFVLLGEDTSGVLWAEGVLVRVHAANIAELTADLVERFKPDAISLEAVVFQELLAPLFDAEFERRGLPLVVQPDYTPVNGHTRIRRLSEPLSRRRIRFRRTPGTEEMVAQLKAFPTHRHDDGPVALEGAWRLSVAMRS